MRLEAVITSVNYGDMLAETLPLNLRHFDDLVVVTAPEDVESQRICRYYGARHVQTDVFRSRWGEFHKAKGINVGLSHLDLGDWVLHLDADCVLPPRTKAMLSRADLDRSYLYGADRYIVAGFDAWRLHQAMPPLQQDNYRVHMDLFRIAPRFSGERMGGFAPPGYFQLWHPGASGVEEYPEEHTSAAKTDVLFASKWWRNSRAMLPEFVVYHLESEVCAQGANWGGRTTKRWGPQPDERSPHHPRNHKPPPVHMQERQAIAERHHPHYGHPPHSTRRPYIQGHPHVGRRLVGHKGRWRGTPPFQFHYQWERSAPKGNGFEPIPGADGPHYRPTRHDEGYRLRISVTAVNDFGRAQATSEPTRLVDCD